MTPEMNREIESYYHLLKGQGNMGFDEQGNPMGRGANQGHLALLGQVKNKSLHFIDMYFIQIDTI